MEEFERIWRPVISCEKGWSELHKQTLSPPYSDAHIGMGVTVVGVVQYLHTQLCHCETQYHCYLFERLISDFFFFGNFILFFNQ